MEDISDGEDDLSDFEFDLDDYSPHSFFNEAEVCQFFFSVFAVKLIKPAVGARNVPEMSVLLSIREKTANSPEPKSLLVRPTQSSKKDESNSFS